jgi:hypothetical protein
MYLWGQSTKNQGHRNQKPSKYNQQMYTIKILKKLCGPFIFMFTWNKNQLLAGVVIVFLGSIYQRSKSSL